MKNLLYPLVAILLSFPSYSSAQIIKEQHPTSTVQLSGLSDQQKLKELVSIHKGTYQMRVSNEDYAPVLNLALFETILNSRQQATNISIEIDEFTRVFIPSATIIESKTFVALKTIVYLSGPTNAEMND